ncbi:putative MFS-type transporter [Pseudocercospora fuligena]|uniref:Putative MFS-type transporter n=1 Tax=Pseudocercospora fuligena TaxID=685502 RepID=A0A8H6VIJ7_9PEZI|nr:putative MFS-type transporter [Pseudocercospora fuligena]
MDPRVSFAPGSERQRPDNQIIEPTPGPSRDWTPGREHIDSSSSQPGPSSPRNHGIEWEHNARERPRKRFWKRVKAAANHVSRSIMPPSPRTPDSTELDDPNNPLRWSNHHKWTTYGTICLFTFMANVNASCFTVAVRPLAAYFHNDANHATWLTNFNVLAFGLGNLFWIPLMRVVGKRPVYLAAILILVLSNVWSNQATSWGSLLGSRIISGLGAAAADATVPSVVFDLFRLHERAYYLAWFHISLASGIFLGPLINAFVVQYHHWWWIPGWMAIAFGFIFVLAFFCIHETSYTEPEVPESKLPWAQHLSVTRALTKESKVQVFKKALLDLLQMSCYPQVLFAGVVVGVFVGWTIIIQITVGQWFTAPPYRWPIGKAGTFHIAGWIGAMFALWFGGKLLDLVFKPDPSSTWQGWLHRRLKLGPPRRLVGLVVPGLLAPPGLLIYGILMGRRRFWVGPAFGYLLHSFGFNTVGNVVVTYNVDCYRQLTAEAMVTLFIIRNIIAVICSFLCNDWLAAVGPEAVFGTMAGIEWAVILVGVLFYLFHEQLYKVCTKFGPAQGMREPPSGIGQDDHQLQFVQTDDHVPDVEHPVPPSMTESMDGTGETESPPPSAMATHSGQRGP